jgi:hypothetical protein
VAFAAMAMGVSSFVRHASDDQSVEETYRPQKAKIGKQLKPLAPSHRGRFLQADAAGGISFLDFLRVWLFHPVEGIRI